jgi:transglutaminase-like putative cysteine protease
MSKQVWKAAVLVLVSAAVGCNRPADAERKAIAEQAKAAAEDQKAINEEPKAAADAQTAAADEQQTAGETAKSREFEFTYGAAVKELPAGAKVRVWIPVPQSSEYQQVKQIGESLPSEPAIATESKFGNKILYFETAAPESGAFDFSVTYQVNRSEVLGLKSKSGVELTDAERKLFLAPDAKVPVDGKPVVLLTGLELPKGNPLELGERLYNKVDDHMKYDKSRPGYGNGDSAWACDSRFGNCTDFHSLFISMARSQGVPARFEIGFPLPPERGEGDIGGYHCWALFYADGHGWVPVDISEADKHPDMKKYYFGNLTENRVTFSVGRDLTLMPKQDAEPLNFFVYPHVEVDGQMWPNDKMERHFKFKDV